MPFSRAEWADRKASIADRLTRGEAGGSYSEAIIILCSTISAMAAEVWPGERIDRRRFVQLLIEFADQPSYLGTISTPLLVGHLRADGRTAEAERIRKAHLDFGRSRVVHGADVDRAEDELISLCPSLSRGYLRKVSYATILYERIRSPFVHEYRPGEKTSSWPMTDDEDARVSYVNWVDDPDRHIFMHAKWLASLVKDLGARTDAAAQSFPRPLPSAWWIDG